jgi:hypothetical protein
MYGRVEVCYVIDTLQLPDSFRKVMGNSIFVREGMPCNDAK